MHPTGFLVLANARQSDLMLDANEFRLANSLAASQASPDRIASELPSPHRWARRLREILDAWRLPPPEARRAHRQSVMPYLAWSSSDQSLRIVRPNSSASAL